MASEALNRARAKYDKEKTTGIYLKLNKVKDADILEHLANIPAPTDGGEGGKQGYIKALIRKDMKGGA